MTTDHELANEIERYCAKAPRSTMVLGYDPPVWQQIIAALRRSQPEGEMPQVCPGSGYAAEFFGSPLGSGVCGICKRTVGINASGLTNTHPYKP